MSYTVNVTLGLSNPDLLAIHGHVWVDSCLRDKHGLRVQDCTCGARRRLRKGPTGDEVVTVPVTSPLGDCLFDSDSGRVFDQGYSTGLNGPVCLK